MLRNLLLLLLQPLRIRLQVRELKRVRRRNLERGETFAMEVPDHVFEMASDMWQELDVDECRGRDVRFLPTQELLET